MDKEEKKKEFEIKGWRTIIYIIGWLFGAWNLLFWIMQVATYHMNNYGDPFINNDFHKRVYYWGYFGIAVAIFFILLVIIFP